jgi:hypothetical protein
MTIHGVVVSVGYAEKLQVGLGRWLSGLDGLTIVSSLKDAATANVVEKSGHRVSLIQTDLFYANGADFNKGAAMAFALKRLQLQDWILLLDADITPPADWRRQLEAIGLEPGWLYGAWRYDENGLRLPDDTYGYGWFQLFHAGDPLAQGDFIETDWRHAGNYDSAILLRWRHAGKLAPALPIRLTHPGGPDHNWYGIGKQKEFQAMQRERIRRGGGWASIEGERLR